jgi:hypothetical protein
MKIELGTFNLGHLPWIKPSQLPDSLRKKLAMPTSKSGMMTIVICGQIFLTSNAINCQINSTTIAALAAAFIVLY